MKKFKIKTYRICSEKIGHRHIRLVFLSDLHNLCFGEENGRLLQAVEEAAPDLVLVGGDMMIAELSPCLHVAGGLLSALVERSPVYYAFGNHEHRLMEEEDRYGDGFRKLCDDLCSQGVHILRNENAQVEIGDGTGKSVFIKSCVPLSWREAIWTGRWDPRGQGLIISCWPTIPSLPGLISPGGQI